MEFLTAWRGELATVLALAGTWFFFTVRLKQNFWSYWAPGVLLGATNEIMTEPEWTYSLQLYLWRDISPAVIVGWGIIFAWLVFLSDAGYARWAAGRGKMVNPTAEKIKVVLCDAAIGIPLLLGNEIFGLHILKVWHYNSILRWDTMIPGLNYPMEGLVALVLFVLTVPAVIRWWKGKDVGAPNASARV